MIYDTYGKRLFVLASSQNEWTIVTFCAACQTTSVLYKYVYISLSTSSYV
jgi:hypothetical protein